MNSTMAPYIIRPGSTDDAEAMAEIFNYYVATSDVIFSDILRSAADMRARIEPLIGRFPFMVAEQEGKVIGYCFAHLWQTDPVYRYTWELTEYLAHDIVGGRVGSALLKSVVEQCREMGAHTLITWVTGSNERCLRMLSRMGFERLGCLKQSGFKFGRWHDDVFLQLML